MKKINLRYFAKLRDDIGLSSETIEGNFNNLSDIYEFLSKKYTLSLSKDYLKVAINDEFCDWDTIVKDNDNIVLIPPVAGG